MYFGRHILYIAKRKGKLFHVLKLYSKDIYSSMLYREVLGGFEVFNILSPSLTHQRVFCFKIL